MREASVYILVDASGSAMKIGWAYDPDLRAAAVARGIDAAKSFSVGGMSRRTAQDLETALHCLFRRDRVGDRAKGDGYTEWYDSRAYDDVRSFIEAHRDRIGWCKMVGVEPIARPAGINWASALATADERPGCEGQWLMVAESPEGLAALVVRPRAAGGAEILSRRPARPLEVAAYEAGPRSA